MRLQYSLSTRGQQQKRKRYASRNTYERTRGKVAHSEADCNESLSVGTGSLCTLSALSLSIDRPIDCERPPRLPPARSPVRCARTSAAGFPLPSSCPSRPPC